MLQRVAPGVEPVAQFSRRAGRRSRGRRWPWLALVLVLAISGLIGWRYLSAAAPAVPSYEFATVIRGTLDDNVPAVGTLKAVRSVDVGAQISGQLKTVHVAVGDGVTEGQLLAEMDPAIYEYTVEATLAQIANLEAQDVNAQAQRVLARQTLNRQENLRRANTSAASELDAAVAALATAESNVDGLAAQIRERRSDLKRAEANLGYTKIYAPLNGTVVSQTSEQGQTLAATQTAPVIVTVADLSTMTVEAKVSEADIGRLTPGMKVWFTTLGDTRQRWEATLRMIEPTPETENNVILYKALFDVPNPDGRLRMTMTAQVFFVVDEAHDALQVPASAIRTSDNGPSVLVRQGNGVIERPVETGLQTRTRVQVLSGLEEGEEVVSNVVTANRSDASTRVRPFGSPRH
ncbi:efflux RND transporter periplasmic adaptor subunit [Aureimonas fodinaquatilis]|uniref:Efflux RND transporter periplasmic adaptor subunit n=1 Tax=Aureimonas fodinaquatilis TaxID=2565783 RepID=A0A5B0DSS0_9HYPH|nr:efflux RND transporter periplasmic adaptor subunit [Aureimonas fodinaquatilis]KAA0969035.1 efflux RND transporter periplasmic adaptor subunit [Aureimonas fodinaquatilis]